MKTKKKKINKNNKTKKNFDNVQCGPMAGNKKYSCFNDKQLLKLKNIWNKRRPDKKITSNDSRYIWSSLREHMGKSCNRESCWLRQNIFRLKIDKSMLNVFAPLRPKSWDNNKNEWLSGEDIEKVMKQYEKKYPYFEFIGPSPIDFDTIESYGLCVWEELCKFNLYNLIKRGIKKIGIIFNLDKHTGPGTHWVSLFIDITSHSIYYYDSTGNVIPKQIKKLTDKIKKQQILINKTKPFKLYINKVEHQMKDSECGIYSLHFIINMLTNKLSWENFQKNKFSDQYISSFRNVYFNDKLY